MGNLPIVSNQVHTLDARRINRSDFSTVLNVFETLREWRDRARKDGLVEW